MSDTALLILYNPYYQSDVIEAHLEVLKREGKVYFGKIKSKMRDVESKRDTSTLETCATASVENNGAENNNSQTNSTAQHNKEDSITLHAGLKMPKPKQNKPLQLFLTDYANLFVCEVVGIVDSEMPESNTESSTDSTAINPRYCPAYYA